MSLEEFCEKREKGVIREAINEIKHFYEINGRYPKESELLRFGFLFSYKDINALNGLSTIGDDHDCFIKTFLDQKSSFENYETFLEYAKSHINDNIGK